MKQGIDNKINNNTNNPFNHLHFSFLYVLHSFIYVFFSSPSHRSEKIWNNAKGSIVRRMWILFILIPKCHKSIHSTESK